MSNDLDTEHRLMAEPPSGAKASNPPGCDSVGSGPEHGVREGARSDRADSGDSRDTGPENTTRFIETELGTLNYAELASLPGERVALTELALFEDESFAKQAIDEHLIQAIHSFIAGDLVPVWARCWRDVELTVGKWLSAAARHVHALMSEYGLDLQTRWSGVESGDSELLLALHDGLRASADELVMNR